MQKCMLTSLISCFIVRVEFPQVSTFTVRKTHKHDFGGLVVPYEFYLEFVFSPSTIRRNTRLECDAEWVGLVHSFTAYNQKSPMYLNIICR